MALPPSASLVAQFLQDQLPFSLPFLLFFLCLVFLLSLQRDKSKSNLPPSPPKLPIIGNLHQLGTLPHHSLHALSQKYGSLMLLYLGRTPTLIVSSAEMAKEIMKTHDVVFSNRPIMKASKAFVFRDRDVTFAPYGDYWRQVRRISVIDLLSVKRVRSNKFIREEEIAIMIKKITAAREMGNTVNLSKIVVTLVNNIVSKTTLGRRLEGEGGGKSEMAVLTKEVMNLFGVFTMEDKFPTVGWMIDKVTGLDGRMKRTAKRFHDFLEEVIEEHVGSKRDDNGNEEDRKDIVDVLLDCQRDLSLGIPLSRNDIKAIILDMFVAGTDSTYTTLVWAMAELMKHPKAMKKAQEEIRRVVVKKPMVEEDDINQMPYLNCAIKEALRLHPPAALSVPRVSTATTTIGGYSIPAKTSVLINLWAISRDPEYWDRPNEFIPDRFINNPIDFKGLDFEFTPFGGGRRVCPGIAFGVTTVESTLANLLCWFDWELPVGANKEDLETEVFGSGAHLKHPLCLVPKFPPP